MKILQQGALNTFNLIQQYRKKNDKYGISFNFYTSRTKEGIMCINSDEMTLGIIGDLSPLDLVRLTSEVSGYLISDLVNKCA